MSCQFCVNPAKFQCTHCETQLCIGHQFSPEELHIKILQRPRKGMAEYYFLVSENRYVNASELNKWIDEDPQDRIVFQDYHVAGTREDLEILMKDYQFKMDQMFATRIFGLPSMDGRWIPIKILGKGHQGAVYQVCNQQSCGYVAKVSLEDNRKEVEYLQNPIVQKVAPEFVESFIENGKYVIIMERYDTDLYHFLLENKNHPQLEQIFTRVFEILYYLVKNGINQNDPKVCNFLVTIGPPQGAPIVTLADYGVARPVRPDQPIPYLMTMLVRGVFLKSLYDPYTWSCGEIPIYDQSEIEYLNRGPKSDIYKILERIHRAHPEYQILLDGFDASRDY